MEKYRYGTFSYESPSGTRLQLSPDSSPSKNYGDLTIKWKINNLSDLPFSGMCLLEPILYEIYEKNGKLSTDLND